MLLLFATLYNVELAGKRIDAHLRELRELLDVKGIPSEWQYVAAAYLVVFVAVLAWVGIIAAKLQRLNRQLAELVEKARERG